MSILFTKKEICRYIATKEVPNRPYFAIRKIKKEANKYNSYNRHLTLGYGFLNFDSDLRDCPVGAIFIDIENRKYILKKRTGKEYKGSFPNEERFKNLTEKLNSIVSRIEISEFIAKENRLDKQIDLPMEIAEPFKGHIQIFGEPRAYNRHHKVDRLTDQDMELIAQAYRDRYTLLPISDLQNEQDAVEGIIYVDSNSFKYKLRDDNRDIQEDDIIKHKSAYYYIMSNVGEPDQSLLIESGVYFYKNKECPEFKVLVKKANHKINKLDLKSFVEEGGKVDLALLGEDQFKPSLELMSDLPRLDIIEKDYHLKLVLKFPNKNNAKNNIIYLSKVERACLFLTANGSIKKIKLPENMDLSNLDNKLRDHKFKRKIVILIKANTVYLSQEKQRCFFYDTHGFTHALKIPDSIDLSNLNNKIKNKDFKKTFLSFFLKNRYSRIKKLDGNLVSFIGRHCNHFIEYPNLNNLDDDETKRHIIMSAFSNKHIKRDFLDDKSIYFEHSPSNPANSLSDFKKVLKAFNRFKDKPDWDLVRVIVESDNTAYDCQIVRYNKLTGGELEAYITDEQVVKLAENLFRLPKRFDACEACQDAKSGEGLFTIDYIALNDFIKSLALYWAKINDYQVSDLNIYCYCLSISRVIFDSFYRGELKLHDKRTGEIFEYSDDPNINRDLLLHWNEVTFTLNKQGIATPEKEDFLEYLGLKSPSAVQTTILDKHVVSNTTTESNINSVLEDNIEAELAILESEEGGESNNDMVPLIEKSADGTTSIRYPKSLRDELPYWGSDILNLIVNEMIKWIDEKIETRDIKEVKKEEFPHKIEFCRKAKNKYTMICEEQGDAFKSGADNINRYVNIKHIRNHIMNNPQKYDLNSEKINKILEFLSYRKTFDRRNGSTSKSTEATRDDSLL